MSLLRPEAWLPESWLNRLNLLWVLPVFVCALIAGIWLTAWLQISNEQMRAEQEVYRQNANLVRTFEEHVSRTVHAIDQTVRFIKFEYEAEGSKLDLGQLVQNGIIQRDMFVQMAIIGPDGWLVMSNIHSTKRIDLSEREHFKVHKNADSGKLFISKPVLGKVSGKWSLQFTRRINRPDGSFGGVVVVSVDPFYFTTFYSDVDIGKNGVVTLVGQDGIVRARSAGNGSGIGVSIRNAKLFQYWPGRNEGNYFNHSVVDGIDRFYSFRSVPGYPLAVIMGVSEKEAMADYYHRRQMYLGGAVLLSLAVAVSSYLLMILALRLRRSQVQAESANRMKSEFLANISHELRTPLNGILGGADYLRQVLVEPDEQEAAGLIFSSSEHLLSLVNSVLDMARIEAGRMTLDLSETRLSLLLQGAVEAFRSTAEQKGLELTLSIGSAEGESDCYMLDRTRLVQVVNNLVQNAIKFTDRGWVTVEAEVRGGVLSLMVSDSGPGIPEDKQAFIFDRFHQGAEFLTRKHGGSGLGLALVRNLVRLQGGKISFESMENVGTTFHVTLPLTQVEKSYAAVDGVSG
ncbi:ATP-binding protein [Chromobacterium sp. IIBBL 290-4]|uniref:sensor histidine kinase n=1 Tax=Chromobacterium sp. IIBBL 290-4 TaxID=2953890 RepID=UPI0020B7FB7C|nr:ATP-binding protein [Chromobacterium sp. IIBBL 290-4]UTH74321.1 ATP-binding protein [Chromobacterium sp. IIBBL 290-4]